MGQSLAIGGDGAFIIANSKKRIAAIIVGQGVVGLGRDGSLIPWQSIGVASLLAQQESVVAQCGSVAWVEFDRTRVLASGFVQTPGDMFEKAAVVVFHGLDGITRERGSIGTPLCHDVSFLTLAAGLSRLA